VDPLKRNIKIKIPEIILQLILTFKTPEIMYTVKELLELLEGHSPEGKVDFLTPDIDGSFKKCAVLKIEILTL
jgi:hypothetical protein